jgi:hypothetical protein
MTTNLSFNTRASAPPLLAPIPATPASQPLGYGAGNDPQGLATALDALQRSPPRSMPALGEDLLAEALLRYAQRNSAPGRASALPEQDAGGGGYGPGPGLGGGTPSTISSTQTGDISYGPLSPAVGGGAQPPNLAPGLAPIDQFNLQQRSPGWAAVLQGLVPQIGSPNAAAGYGALGGASGNP